MNLIARQIYGNKKVATANTFIGDVSSTISTASLLAAKLGISVSTISNFTIVGSDIQCNITGSYAAPSNFFQNSLITYYWDDDNLVTSLNGYSFDTALNFYDFRMNGITSINQREFQNSKVREINLPNITSAPVYSFSEISPLKKFTTRIYIPNCATLGTNVNINENVFFGITSGSIIYAKPSLETINSGGVEADLAYAITQGAIVRYVTNFTKPNPVTTLSSGSIYNNSVQLNFTPPTGSTNAIEYYECWANGVRKNDIKESGLFITELTQNTLQNIVVYAVDIFKNKSVVSNSISITTTNNSWDIATNLISYYKQESNSNDNFGVNNAVNTSVSFASGKIGNAGVYNGTTSKSIVGNPTNLQLSTGTISCWVKASSSGSSYRSLFGKTEAYNLFLVDGVLIVYNWGSFGGSGNKSTGINLNDGLWHHVVFVFESGTALNYIYIDSILKLTFSMSVANQYSNFCIGSSNSSQYVNASIDEGSVYETKLTQTQIDTLYNSGNGITL